MRATLTIEKFDMFTSFDQACMQRALALAQMAASEDEVPVGAVIVLDECILAEGFNLSIAQCDPTAHAEMIALRLAAKKLKNYRLVNTTLYTTLEPCSMCAGAMIHARVKRVVYAASDARAGAGGSVFNLLQSDALNHCCDIATGLYSNESRELLQRFFSAKRSRAAFGASRIDNSGAMG